MERLKKTSLFSTQSCASGSRLLKLTKEAMPITELHIFYTVKYDYDEQV